MKDSIDKGMGHGAWGIGQKRLQGQRGKFISPFAIGFG
jgi:hypothetical protein